MGSTPKTEWSQQWGSTGPGDWARARRDEAWRSAQKTDFVPYITGGTLGQSVLGGDRAALAGLLNPQLNDLIASQRQGYADATQTALNAVGDRFQRAGAYGGSRQGVASGVAAGEIAKAQAENEAQMRYQATNDAYTRAGILSQAGLNATQMQGGLLADVLKKLPHGWEFLTNTKGRSSGGGNPAADIAQIGAMIAAFL